MKTPLNTIIMKIPFTSSLTFKPFLHLLGTVLSVGFLIASFPGTSLADIIFQDNMNYADTTAMRDAWARGTSGASSRPNALTQTSYTASPLAALSNPTPASGSFMALSNGVAFRSLDSTVSDSLTLSFLISSSSYSRSGSVFLLNAAGDQGYGINFNSGNVNNFSGEGSITIRSFNNTDNTNWGTFGNGTSINAGSLTNSGHPVTGYEVLAAPDNNQNNATYDTANWQDFAAITLTWDSETGALVALVDGVEVATATDTNFSSFESIYVRGNATTYFDSIQLNVVPEPTTSSIVGVCGLIALMRSRHRRNRA